MHHCCVQRRYVRARIDGEPGASLCTVDCDGDNALSLTVADGGDLKRAVLAELRIIAPPSDVQLLLPRGAESLAPGFMQRYAVDAGCVLDTGAGLDAYFFETLRALEKAGGHVIVAIRAPVAPPRVERVCAPYEVSDAFPSVVCTYGGRRSVELSAAITRLALGVGIGYRGSLTRIVGSIDAVVRMPFMLAMQFGVGGFTDGEFDRSMSDELATLPMLRHTASFQMHGVVVFVGLWPLT
eukprot:m51a1_g8704 hypothetical protein (239) ;mRNA; f:95437-96409